MPTRVDRRTVDLSGYPDLVVIYLGMRVNRLTGMKTLAGFGPRISKSAAAKPEGLLLHENIIYSLFPMHVGMRQYWRDMESLLAWTRSDPHRQWWKSFLNQGGERKDSNGNSSYRDLSGFPRYSLYFNVFGWMRMSGAFLLVNNDVF